MLDGAPEELGIQQVVLFFIIPSQHDDFDEIWSVSKL